MLVFTLGQNKATRTLLIASDKLKLISRAIYLWKVFNRLGIFNMGMLDGKVALVTGAGGGLGETHALLLAKEEPP